MTVKDVMTLLESPDRVRVIKDGEEIYNQYFANMEVDKDIVAQIGDAEVKRFRAIPEITVALVTMHFSGSTPGSR